MGKHDHKTVNKNLVFGFDVGIASCGWAVIDKTPDNEQILAIGVHCFETPEDSKSKKLLNMERRMKRGQRRVINRRQERMRNIRNLIREHVLPSLPRQKTSDDIFDVRDFHQRVENQIIQELRDKDLPFNNLPYILRVDALGRKLTSEEALLILTHLAKHRGFKSNSKSDGNNAKSDGGKVLSAIGVSAELLSQYKSFAEMLMMAPQFVGHKRNKAGKYSHTPKRAWIEDEAKAIITAQARHGATWATSDFKEKFLEVAFSQRPLQGVYKMVGYCPFETSEKRSAKSAPSFEIFRLLQKLAHCDVQEDAGKEPRRLTADERRAAISDLGQKATLTWKKLKTKIGLPTTASFSAAPDQEAEKKCVSGVSAGGFSGTKTLRDVLGPHWDSVKDQDRDLIASILSFNEDPSEIETILLNQAQLDAEVLEKITSACVEGVFKNFRGAGHISANVARKLNPHLINGCVYSEACDRAGYSHSAVAGKKLDAIKNPTVRRALGRAFKQAQILRREYGTPGAVHVELLRDVGKSAEERGAIEEGIKKRTKEREVNREELAKCLKQPPKNVRRKVLELYEMLREQHMKCAFCDIDIRPHQLIGGTAHHAHIWPQSDFFDNSFVNKVCACATCNQNMRNRTPFEWAEKGGFPTDWENFEARVKAFNCKQEKKRRLLSRTFRERLKDPQFNERNKVDTSYVARDLQHLIAKEFYPNDYVGMQVKKNGKRRIMARPGALTAVLRQAWLSSVWEKDRNDDRHHAMDALIVACMDESMLQRLTKAWQRLGESGLYKRTPEIEPPWPKFADHAMVKYGEGETGGWHICRTETRRVRGASHDATIRRRLGIGDHATIFERKDIQDRNFTANDLSKLPDIAANWRLAERLAIWIAAGKPADSSKVDQSTIDKAISGTPQILVKLSMQPTNLPKTIISRWSDQSLIEKETINLLTEWANLPPEGETRKVVNALEESDLGQIHPNDESKRSILTNWMAAYPLPKDRINNSPHDENGEVIEHVRVMLPAALPRSIKGDAIRRVRLTTTTKTARQIAPKSMGGKSPSRQGGFVENKSITRTDVFYVSEKRLDPEGRKITPGYYLVPIYNWQIIDKTLATPLNAILASQPEEQWPEMCPEDFLYSLYKNSWIEITKKDDKRLAGYFRSSDRANGGIQVADPIQQQSDKFNSSIKTVKAVEKFTTDRLGQKHKVRRETWPGHCHPPKPPRRDRF